MILGYVDYEDYEWEYGNGNILLELDLCMINDQKGWLMNNLSYNINLFADPINS